MGLEFDYRPDAAVHPAEQARAVLEMLQGCLQMALGHELPNRMVGIQGLARLLLLEQTERLNEEGRFYLNRLAGSVRQADELIRVLADLGRLLRDPGPPQALDLAEVALEAAAEAKVLCPAREIEYDLIRPLPGLTLPRRPWYQVLVLVFRQLAERAGPGRTCLIKVSGQAAPSCAEVRIEEPGLVLAPDELEGLFEPFGRGSTGLELFPVRLLVASFAGRLRIDSLAPSGTCFVFHLCGPGAGPRPAPPG